jgi:hypothetical protein
MRNSIMRVFAAVVAVSPGNSDISASSVAVSPATGTVFVTGPV